MIWISFTLICLLSFGDAQIQRGGTVVGDDLESLRSCAVDCFAKNRLPQDPQSKNRTWFDNVYQEYHEIDGNEIHTMLFYRGPGESDFIRVYYMLKRNATLVIKHLNGIPIDVVRDPQRDCSPTDTESMLAVRRKRQASCIWDCTPKLNQIGKGKW
ncbi:hypothetical protein PFISCL1PPCAC_2662, partial [Pristionchus fissidentatus]